MWLGDAMYSLPFGYARVQQNWSWNAFAAVLGVSALASRSSFGTAEPRPQIPVY